MVKRLLLTAALAVVLMAAPAAAQQYPPGVNDLTVSDPTPKPGQTIDVRARTCAPGATVTVALASGPVLGTGTADPSGVANLQVTIPADTTLGAHTITAVCGDLSLSASINVVSGHGSGGGSGSLPRTGDDSSIPLAKFGLGLAAIGGVVTAMAAKRRKAAAMSA